MPNDNKTRKHRFVSIRKQLFIYFTGFAVIILMMLWMLQIVFLQTTYVNSRKNTLTRVSYTISKLYGSESFEDDADHLAAENDCEFLLTDSEGNLEFSQREDSMPRGNLLVYMMNFNFKNLVEKMENDTDGKQLFSVTLPNETELYVYCTQLTSDTTTNYMFLVTSIDPMNSTTLILTNQLMLISILVLALAAVMSFYLSRRLSSPVQSMANSSKLLAEGKYVAENVYTGNFLELEELSQSLDYASKEISQVSKLRRELIANTSHDLRTPLTMIKAYAEMIRDLSGDNPEKRNKHLSIIIDETDRLSMLVNDMLDISRFETGRVQMKYSVVNLSDCIDEILKKFNVLIERDGYTLTFVPLPDSFVIADRSRMIQVLYNLISNAIVHVGEDKAVIIELIKDKNKLRVNVTDHGEGIPKDELPHIWERYYRTSESHKRTQIGTGLGLSIVKSILLEHNAAFGVTSRPGKGSTFFFELTEATMADRQRFEE